MNTVVKVGALFAGGVGAYVMGTFMINMGTDMTNMTKSVAQMTQDVHSMAKKHEWHGGQYDADGTKHGRRSKENG